MALPGVSAGWGAEGSSFCDLPLGGGISASPACVEVFRKGEGRPGSGQRAPASQASP